MAPSPTYEPFNGSILKRVPQSARVQGATVLCSCVREVLKHFNDIGTWVRLVLFPACFAKPIRGGARSNLTSSIFAQLGLFDEAGVMRSLNTQGYPQLALGMHRISPGGRREEGEDAAKRASIKLADGDIRCAVCLQCSIEKGVPPNQAAYAIMQDKHLMHPFDRRLPPILVGTP